MQKLLELDARASVKLPLRWTVARRLPSMPDALPKGVLRWPPRGPLIVKATQRRFQHLADLDGVTIDLVFAEVETASELDWLAAFASDTGATMVCLVGGAVPRDAWEAISYEHPSVSVLAREELGDDLLPYASRLTSQLVRGRIALQLTRHWRQALSDYAHLGIEATGGRFSLPPVEPRPVTAPLATIEHDHVAGVVGLWFEGAGKAARRLNASPGKVHRKLETPPPGIALGVAPLPKLARARLLVLEDDKDLAEATALRLLQVAKRLRRPLSVDIAASAEKAKRLVEKHGAPELLWADVRLAGPMSGVDFVRWLRREKHATVVFGKTGTRDRQAIASLYRLGALHVWCGNRVPSLTSALTTGLEVAAEAKAIRRRVVGAALADGRLATRLRQAFTGAAAQERAKETCRRLAALDADEADHPPPAALDEVPLKGLRAVVARYAHEPGDVRATLARALGVSVKTLDGLLKRGKQSEETTET